MNLFNKNSRKLRHGSISIGITAAVIVAVLLLNIGATALFSHNHIFLDMSPESIYGKNQITTMYSLMDETVYQLDRTFTQIDAGRAEDDPVQVDIIFCSDPDMLLADARMRYVYYTALALAKEFPDHINVETTNVWLNPSSVDAYRTNSYSQIYQNNIIISSGNDFRIATARSFYVYSEYGATTPWAYHGEKNFVSYILAVTQSESPICCLTVNHGEPIQSDEYSEFRKLIESIGYEIRYLDLKNEEIPEDCRLIITLAPTKDFDPNFNLNSEDDKLQAYLDKNYAYMVFADADTPYLMNMESFLEKWGISFNRYEGTDGKYQISDPKDSVDAKSEGIHLIGQYEVNAPSAAWTEDMREFGASPKVVFPDAIGILYSKDYTVAFQPEDEDTGALPHTYAYYSKDGDSRLIYDLFRAGDSAAAYVLDANGNKLRDENDVPVVYSPDSPFRLMTISSEEVGTGEGLGYTTVRTASYVCAVGSVRAVSNEMLQSSTYGNTDLMLSVLRELGEEIEPVGLDFKVMHQDAINADLFATVNTTAWTIVLVVLPMLGFTIAGVVILVRRKTRH